MSGVVRGKGYGVGPQGQDTAQVQGFEDLRAWQAARELAKLTYRITDGAPLRQDPSLCRQMQRAAVSAMANIAEGHGRTGLGEFARFLSLALGSLTELRSHLYVAFDTELVSRDAFDQLMALAVSTGKIAGALRSAIEKRRNGGSQIRESTSTYQAADQSADDVTLYTNDMLESELPPPTPSPIPPPEIEGDGNLVSADLPATAYPLPLEEPEARG